MYPGKFHFVGRLVSIVFSIASVLIIFACGDRYKDRLTGLIAAGFFAFSSMTLIRTSWALPDSTYLLMTVLSLFFLIRFMKSTSMFDLIASGFFCGLTIATKYNAGTLIIVGVLAIALPLIEHSRHEKLNAKIISLLKAKAFYIYGCFMVAGFLMGTPYFIVEMSTYLSGLVMGNWSVGS